MDAYQKGLGLPKKSSSSFLELDEATEPYNRV
jgi:hypothetical protein